MFLPLYKGICVPCLKLVGVYSIPITLLESIVSKSKLLWPAWTRCSEVRLSQRGAFPFLRVLRPTIISSFEENVVVGNGHPLLQSTIL